MAEPLRRNEMDPWQEQGLNSGSLESALWDTFFEMERRRLRRQAYGRQVAHSIWTTAFEVSLFLGLFAYGLATVRMRILGTKAEDSLEYLSIPILITVGAVLWALYQSCTTRENVPLVWGKTWGWLLVAWAFWLYEPEADCKHKPGASGFIFGESHVGESVFWLFCCLELATFLLWFIIVKIYPVVAQRCRSASALRLLWRVRPSTTARSPLPQACWYSYRPNGACCSLKRCHFQYHGERDELGRPHGHGVWRDDSYHGEVLEGEWRNGHPVAPFVSRVFGSGAMSMGLRIGYGTVRPETLSGTNFTAVRPPGAELRFGVVSVECSVAGGFLSFLPEVHAHQAYDKADDMVFDLQGSTGALSRRHSGVPTCLAQDALMEAGPGKSLGTASSSSPASGSFGLVPQPSYQSMSTALVFIHGYNCPIDWACMRVGQLSSLAKLSPHVMPFVFSWPCGRTFSYWQLLHDLPTLAQDLPRFLEALYHAGIREVHLAAHSLGCELVTAALPQLQALVEGNGKPSATSGGTGDEDSELRISTITFFNATCPRDTFIPETLPRLLSTCHRLTLYCDRDDVALVSSDMLFRRGKAIGRCTETIDYEMARVDVVDCTSMDTNVNGLRHSYFDLNAHVVADFQELLRTQHGASRRSRLVRTSMDARSNVFAFLAPPVFVSW